VDIIAMIPEWSLGLEVLSGIAIIVMFAVHKNIVISYLGVWLLALSGSLSLAKEINDLKEDLQSPDLEKRRAAMEKVEFDEWAGAMISFALLLFDFLILLFGSANFTQVELDIMILVMVFTFPLPALIVFEQSFKVTPPEPEKATTATSWGENMNYVEEVDKAYDEFQDVYGDLERLVRSTDRLREPDRQLLLIALGELKGIVKLLSELPSVDGNGRYIEEDFMVQRIRDATELLREIRNEIIQGTPDRLAREELDVDVMGYAVAIRKELLDVLKRILERARQEGRGGRDGGDK
jgi:hypothetical protein